MDSDLTPYILREKLSEIKPPLMLLADKAIFTGEAAAFLGFFRETSPGSNSCSKSLLGRSALGS